MSYQPYRRMLAVLVWSSAALVCPGSYAQSLPADANAAQDFERRGPGGVIPKPELLQAQPTPETKPADPKPLDFEVNYVYRPKGHGDLKPLTQGSVLHSGDHYKIQFTPKEDCHVYIFQVDSSRKVYPLFPMLGFKGVIVTNRNPVRAGVTYQLPAKDKSFELDEQKGEEAIYFLAFRERHQALEQEAYRLEVARLQQDSALAQQIETKLTADFAKRGLKQIVEDPKTPVTVSFEQKEAELPVQRLNGLCEKCVSVVTFEHR